jgi:fructokinase
MRIGIDLGGTKIEGIALDSDGTVAVRKRVASPASDYKAIITSIVRLITSIEQQFGSEGSIGVGIPGSVSAQTGLIRNANTVSLIGNNLKQDLEKNLGRPVRLANDADCFTLSEATDGAGKDSETVFGVIIGTGTGGGIVVRGQLLDGPNRIAGEWGHNPLPWPTAAELPGPDCYCGRQGCIETFLSGPGFRHAYRQAGGEDLQPAEIVYRANDGELLAEQLMQSYEDRMARSLATIINVIDPHTIVLGGGMSNIERLYRNVPAIWDRYIFSPEKARTRLLQAMHGDASGVRGAAWLWPASSQQA